MVISEISAAVLLGICAISNQPVEKIDHFEAPKFKRIFPFPRDRVQENEVYTQRVPGICFILFRCQLATFMISCFCSLACWAFLTHVVDCCANDFPIKMLTEGVFCLGLPLIIEHLMIPIYSFLL